MKGTIADIGHAVWDGYACDTGAETKRIFAYERNAGRYRDLGELRAIIECPISDCGDRLAGNLGRNGKRSAGTRVVGDRYRNYIIGVEKRSVGFARSR